MDKVPRGTNEPCPFLFELIAPERLEMKLILVLCLTLSVHVPMVASSHPHGPPLEDEQLLNKAIEYTRKIVAEPELIDGLSLGATWDDELEVRIHKRGAIHVVVSLFNARNKKTLYVLLGSYGRFYDANFHGAFAEF